VFLARYLARSLGTLLFPVWVAPPGVADREFLKRPIILGPFFAVAGMIVALEGQWG
jgi:hypothetical protein